MTITNIPQLIKTARNGRSQAVFADLLGVRQSTLSRYERGAANPKTTVIEQCMHMVHWLGREIEPSADELADKIRVLLGGDDRAMLRVTLSKIIDGLIVQTKTGRAAHSSQRNRGYP